MSTIDLFKDLLFGAGDKAALIPQLPILYSTRHNYTHHLVIPSNTCPISSVFYVLHFVELPA